MQRKRYVMSGHRAHLQIQCSGVQRFKSPDRTSVQDRGRGWAGGRSVTAPSLAEATSRAYFARAPRV